MGYNVVLLIPMPVGKKFFEPAGTEKSCKLMCGTGFQKFILHGITVFVLWHDKKCTAVENCLNLNVV